MKRGEKERTYFVNWKAGEGDDGRVQCLACYRARRAGRPWGCLVHVGEGVMP
jgi:hypothetical protein